MSFSKTGATLYYAGRSFRSLKGHCLKANYFDTEAGAEFRISGPRHDGQDSLCAGGSSTQIDADVRE